MDDPNTLRSITDAVMTWAEEAKKPSPWAAMLSKKLDTYRKTGRDFALWSAPCLIVAITPKVFLPMGKSNTFFALVMHNCTRHLSVWEPVGAELLKPVSMPVMSLSLNF